MDNPIDHAIGALAALFVASVVFAAIVTGLDTGPALLADTGTIIITGTDR